MSTGLSLETELARAAEARQNDAYRPRSRIVPRTDPTPTRAASQGPGCSMRTGERRITCRSGRFIYWTIRCRENRCRPNTSSRGCWGLNPVNDNAVLPVLYLNGYEIAKPTVPGPRR